MVKIICYLKIRGIEITLVPRVNKHKFNDSMGASKTVMIRKQMKKFEEFWQQ